VAAERKKPEPIVIERRIPEPPLPGPPLSPRASAEAEWLLQEAWTEQKGPPPGYKPH
jgi:hypothetical protein